MFYIVDSVYENVVRLIGEDESIVTIEDIGFDVKEGDMVKEIGGVMHPFDFDAEITRKRNNDLLDKLTDK